MYPGVSDSKGTKGLNYNKKHTQLKTHCKCVWIAAKYNSEKNVIIPGNNLEGFHKR